jgi:hypothetical protein
MFPHFKVLLEGAVGGEHEKPGEEVGEGVGSIRSHDDLGGDWGGGGAENEGGE